MQLDWDGYGEWVQRGVTVALAVGVATVVGASSPASAAPVTEVATVTTAVTQPARVAPGCLGENCRGRYSIDVGCAADARTVDTEDIVAVRRPISRVEPRGSVGGEVGGDAVGGAAGGAAGAAGGAAGGRASGRVGGQAEVSVGVERGQERSVVGVLEVRHSPRCGTAWARILTEGESPISRISITKAGGSAVSRDLRPGLLDRRSATPPGSYYSPMVYVGDTGRVLAAVRGGAGGPHLADDRNPTTGWVTPAQQ